MSIRKTVLGLCVLCALAVCAVAAQSATAAVAGTTAFTCKKNPVSWVGTKFSKEHCKDVDTAANGEWGHVTIPENKTTSITGSNAKTPEEEPSTAVLTSTQAGIAEELQATTVSGSGWMTNATVENEKKEKIHFAHGEGKITYSGVTVTKPVGKGCNVYEHPGGEEMGAKGTVVTNQLKATTLNQAEDRVKFEPAAGETFAIFWVTECTTSALNGTYEVKGSLTAKTDGATIIATGSDVTTQNTLKVRGQKAGLDGSLTLVGREKESSEPYTALSITTVETP